MSVSKETLLYLLTSAIEGLNLTEIETLLKELRTTKYTGITTVDVLKIHAKLNQMAAQVSKDNAFLRNWLHDEAIKISSHIIGATDSNSSTGTGNDG